MCVPSTALLFYITFWGQPYTGKGWSGESRPLYIHGTYFLFLLIQSRFQLGRKLDTSFCFINIKLFKCINYLIIIHIIAVMGLLNIDRKKTP